MKQMNNLPLFLYDKENRTIGTVKIHEVQETLFFGTITFIDCPPSLMQLFNSYEDMVNSQVLPVVDKLEEEIAQLKLRVNDHKIYDVQIMNGTDITFRSKALI